MERPEEYFDRFLKDAEAYDRMRILLDEARQTGHTYRIRALADHTFRQLELFYEICEEMKNKKDGLDLDL